MLRALAATGGVITSAGILLAAVFAVLGVLPLVVLAQLGTVICVGVLLDTLVVRTVLVPSLAVALGDASGGRVGSALTTRPCPSLAPVTTADRPRAPRMADVARLARVSPTTVSRVDHGPRAVRAETARAGRDGDRGSSATGPTSRRGRWSAGARARSVSSPSTPASTARAAALRGIEHAARQRRVRRLDRRAAPARPHVDHGRRRGTSAQLASTACSPIVPHRLRGAALAATSPRLPVVGASRATRRAIPDRRRRPTSPGARLVDRRTCSTSATRRWCTLRAPRTGSRRTPGVQGWRRRCAARAAGCRRCGGAATGPRTAATDRRPWPASAT